MRHSCYIQIDTIAIFVLSSTRNTLKATTIYLLIRLWSRKYPLLYPPLPLSQNKYFIAHINPTSPSARILLCSIQFCFNGVLYLANHNLCYSFVIFLTSLGEKIGTLALCFFCWHPRCRPLIKNIFFRRYHSYYYVYYIFNSWIARMRKSKL